MEYTKDVVFPVHYAKEKDKLKKGKWKKYTIWEGKRLMITILTFVAFLIGIDLILINSFIQLFSTM